MRLAHVPRARDSRRAAERRDGSRPARRGRARPGPTASAHPTGWDSRPRGEAGHRSASGRRPCRGLPTPSRSPTESPAHCGANGAPHAAQEARTGREIDHPVLRQRIGEPQRRFDGARLKTLLAGVPRRVFIPGAGSGARSPAGVLDVHGLCDQWLSREARRLSSVIDAHGVKHDDEEYAGAEEQRRTAHVAPVRAQIGMLPLIARA